MAKIKYITIEQLREDLVEVVNEVNKGGVEYIVSVDGEAKVKITPINGRKKRQVIATEAIGKETLNEFVS